MPRTTRDRGEWTSRQKTRMAAVWRTWAQVESSCCVHSGPAGPLARSHSWWLWPSRLPDLMEFWEHLGHVSPAGPLIQQKWRCVMPNSPALSQALALFSLKTRMAEGGRLWPLNPLKWSQFRLLFCPQSFHSVDKLSSGTFPWIRPPLMPTRGLRLSRPHRTSQGSSSQDLTWTSVLLEYSQCQGAHYHMRQPSCKDLFL